MPIVRRAIPFVLTSLSTVLINLDAQTPPVKMGLWETTAHTETKASSEVTAVMLSQGQTIPAPISLKTLSCHSAADWNQALARVEEGVKGCALMHRSDSGKGFAAAYKCERGNTHVEVDVNLSWPTAEKYGMSNRIVTTFNGVSGEAATSFITTSRFVSSNCGKLSPGANTIIH